MIQTINPYATARTAEIMSRYRPIAPKPEATADAGSAAENDSSAVPSGLRKSPYLRNVWAHLQARPTRTRKRGRTAAFSPPSVKRQLPCLQGLAPPPFQVITAATSPAAAAKNLASMHISLVPLKCGLDTAVTTLAESVAALPLLRRCLREEERSCGEKGIIDLNMSAADNLLHGPPEELDLLPKLQEQPTKPTIVISPRPVRPVGSSIVVKSISGGGRDTAMQGTTMAGKKAEEVEEAVEAEALPSVVSDSNNKVKIANSAYREMVGQPECGWLDYCAGKHGKRIGGEVCLRFEDDSEVVRVLMSSVQGFSCRVKIEWESSGEGKKKKKKESVEACCSGVRLGCQGKDYQFLWRFHTIEEEASSRNG